MLVATDIAARGIDVEALGHVVNYDVPGQPEDYIHRVGRTGRAELTGEAFTFVAPEDEATLRTIERAIGRSLPRVLLPDFDYGQRPPETPAARPQQSRQQPRRQQPRSQPPRPHGSQPSRSHAGPQAAGGGRGRGRQRPSAARPEAAGAWAGRLETDAARPPAPPGSGARRTFRPRRGR